MYPSSIIRSNSILSQRRRRPEKNNCSQNRRRDDEAESSGTAGRPITRRLTSPPGSPEQPSRCLAKWVVVTVIAQWVVVTVRPGVTPPCERMLMCSRVSLTHRRRPGYNPIVLITPPGCPLHPCTDMLIKRVDYSTELMETKHNNQGERCTCTWEENT